MPLPPLTDAQLGLLDGDLPGGPLGIRSGDIRVGTRLNELAAQGSVGEERLDELEANSDALSTRVEGLETSVNDLGDAAGLDVGTTAGTVAAGDHTHANLLTSDQKAALDNASTPPTAANVLLTEANGVRGGTASTTGELPLYSGTGGRLLMRSNTLSGLVQLVSGVVGMVTTWLLAGLTGPANRIPGWDGSGNPTTLTSFTPSSHGSDHRIGGADPTIAALVVDPASPYTIAPSERKFSVASSTIFVLPATGVNVGEDVCVSSSAATPITITFRRAASDNIDGASTDVAVIVPAHATVGAIRRASADWRSLQPSSIDPAAPRAICIYVSSGVLGWVEQILYGSTWITLSTFTALNVETNGGVTFSGSTLVIPAGIAATTATQSCADERYVLLSDTSSILQALIVAGTRCTITLEETSMEQITGARWGVAFVRTNGTAFDASTENIVSSRIGWTGATYQNGVAADTAAFAGTSTSTNLGRRTLSPSIGFTDGFWTHATSAGVVGGANAPDAAIPDRIYITASASGAPTAATCNVVAPVVRVAFYPATL